MYIASILNTSFTYGCQCNIVHYGNVSVAAVFMKEIDQIQQ